MKNERINAEAMLTHSFGLDQVSEAIQLMLGTGESLKPVILPELTKAEPTGEFDSTHHSKNVFVD